MRSSVGLRGFRFEESVIKQHTGLICIEGWAGVDRQPMWVSKVRNPCPSSNTAKMIRLVGLQGLAVAGSHIEGQPETIVNEEA